MTLALVAGAELPAAVRGNRLNRPAALRGFFNSEQCVTVVDCRAEYGSLKLPDCQRARLR
jgi:hypothetical protein